MLLVIGLIIVSWFTTAAAAAADDDDDDDDDDDGDGDDDDDDDVAAAEAVDAADSSTRVQSNKRVPVPFFNSTTMIVNQVVDKWRSILALLDTDQLLKTKDVNQSVNKSTGNMQSNYFI